MNHYLLLLLLAVTPSTAFYRPSETEAPGKDKDGDVDYDLPHLFFQVNNGIDDNKDQDPATNAPTIKSSSSPTVTPTRAPTGPPTETPTAPLATLEPSLVSPGGLESSGTPSEVPSIAPSTTSSTVTPSVAPTMEDITISDVTLPANLNETRTSSHRFQWGAKYQGCDHQKHVVFLSCGDGGRISSIVGNDTVCEQLSLDRAQCNSTHSPLDENGSYVDFKCTGVKSTHLTGTAEIFSSTASNCNATFNMTTDVKGDTPTSRGGIAALFGVLGRVCTTSNGKAKLQNTYDCNKGTPGQQGENRYCAAGSMCTIDEMCINENCSGGEPCSTLLDGISMSNPDDREACSEVATTADLMGANFNATRLGASYDVEWTFSGSALGCEAAIPDVTFECQNGGTAKLGDTYPYCLEQGSTITCTNPEGGVAESRASIFIKLWCHGESYDQLDLSADLPKIQDDSSTCGKEGMVVQGLRLRKACKKNELVSLPSFCEDPNQVFAESNLCYAGYYCTEESCEGQQVEVEAVSAVSSDPLVQSCVRAA